MRDLEDLVEVPDLELAVGDVLPRRGDVLEQLAQLAAGEPPDVVVRGRGELAVVRDAEHDRVLQAELVAPLGERLLLRWTSALDGADSGDRSGAQKPPPVSQSIPSSSARRLLSSLTRIRSCHDCWTLASRPRSSFAPARTPARASVSAVLRRCARVRAGARALPRAEVDAEALRLGAHQLLVLREHLQGDRLGAGQEEVGEARSRRARGSPSRSGCPSPGRPG